MNSQTSVEREYVLLQPATTFENTPSLLSICLLTHYEAQQKNKGFGLNGKTQRYVAVASLPNNLKKGLRILRESV